MSPAAASDLYLVVPIYNEVGNLDRLVSSLDRVRTTFADAHRVRVIVVDDGSTDGGAVRLKELAGDLDLTVLADPVNQGPGVAFARAFTYLATRLKATDLVISLEGDNTSRCELIGQMLRRAEENYDVVLASPYMYGGGIANTSPMRVFLSHMANAFVKELLGIHGILTMSSFFRLYRGAVLLKLQGYYGPGILERSGFECMVEMLLKMIYVRATISEVPMLLDTNLRAGKSKMKIMRTIRGYLALGQRTAAWRKIAQHPALRVSLVETQKLANT